MFTEADKYELFTREEIEARLKGKCGYDWFVEEYRLKKRCKGKLIAGADILHALANPPVPEIPIPLVPTGFEHRASRPVRPIDIAKSKQNYKQHG